METVLMLVD